MGWAEYEKERRAIVRIYSAKRRECNARFAEREREAQRIYRNAIDKLTSALNDEVRVITQGRDEALAQLRDRYHLTKDEESSNETTA